MNAKCNNCHHFLAVPGHTGTCWRFPPVEFFHSRNKFARPEVSPTDTCGEFKPAGLEEVKARQAALNREIPELQRSRDELQTEMQQQGTRDTQADYERRLADFDSRIDKLRKRLSHLDDHAKELETVKP
jgi:septal ring factor EnvC (AmiA/AmiB activator)